MNGIFYAVLAVFAGSLIVAVGGGGIAPMRQQWERLFGVIEKEAARIKDEGIRRMEESPRHCECPCRDGHVHR